MTSGEVRVDTSDLTGKANTSASRATTANQVSQSAPSACMLSKLFGSIRAGSLTPEGPLAFQGAGEAPGWRSSACCGRGLRTVDERTRDTLDEGPAQPTPGVKVPEPPPPTRRRFLRSRHNRCSRWAGGDPDGFMTPRRRRRSFVGPLRSDAHICASDAGDSRAVARGTGWFDTRRRGLGRRGGRRGRRCLRHHKDGWSRCRQYKYLADQAEDIANAQDKWAASTRPRGDRTGRNGDAAGHRQQGRIATPDRARDVAELA